MLSMRVRWLLLLGCLLASTTSANPKLVRVGNLKPRPGAQVGILPGSFREHYRGMYSNAVDQGDIFTRRLNGINKIVIYGIDYKYDKVPIGRASEYFENQLESSSKAILKTYDLDGRGYKIINSSTLTGEAAVEFLKAWQAQTLGCFMEERAGCFAPHHALRFYANEILVLEARVCFSCHNVSFQSINNSYAMCGFEDTAAMRRLQGTLSSAQLEPGVSADPPERISTSELATMWNSPEYNDLFSEAQRRRVISIAARLVSDCIGTAGRAQDPRPIDVRVEFTIPSGTLDASSVPSAVHGSKSGVAVTDVSVTVNPADEGLAACGRDRIGFLHFLPSRRDPLRIRLRLP